MSNDPIEVKIKKAIVDEKIRRAAKDQVDKDRPKPQLIIRKASDVPDEPLVTYFGGRLTSGAFQLMVGPGEAGKGMGSVDVVARLTLGECFPDEPGKGRPPMNVMVCVTEDAASRVKARLRAAGADLERVFFVDGPPQSRGGLIVPSPIAFDEDAGVLVERARDLKIGALFLETTVEHLGDRNGHRQPSTNNENEVRRALSPVIAACREVNLIGWGVMHPRKSMDGGIEDSISGSAGFRNVARTALHVYPDPTDESDERWRLLLCSKSNYLARRPPTLRFRIEPWDQNPAEGRVVWGIPGRTLVDPRSAEEIWSDMEAKRSKKDRRDHAVVEAEEFLRTLFQEGQKLKAADVRKAATEAGIAWRAIERAKSKMKVKSVRGEYQGPFLWEFLEEKEDM
jgi:putative DNA primase/helicase